MRASELPEPCVFDTELFYIAEYFPNVESYKIISDTLNRGEYESFFPEASWKRFFEMYNSAASENRNAAVEIGTQKKSLQAEALFCRAGGLQVGVASAQPQESAVALFHFERERPRVSEFVSAKGVVDRAVAP